MRPLTVLALALAAPLIAAPVSARTWSQEWPVGVHPSLHVSTNDAKVRVHRGPPGKVTAIVEYTVDVWGLHSRVNPPVIEFSRAGDAITVSARSHSNAVFFGGMSERFHIDVTVPAESDVQVRTGDGGIQLEPITGMIDLQAGDGHIGAHGARGHIRLTTGDGGIDADSLDGQLEARSGDGHVKVAGRFDELDLHTGDGHVDASVLRGSQPTRPWYIETGDGGVMLRIPRNLMALLDASARDGRVHVQLPITTGEHSSRHELRGQLNGGTVPVRIRTGDGSVTLTLSE